MKRDAIEKAFIEGFKMGLMAKENYKPVVGDVVIMDDSDNEFVITAYNLENQCCHLVCVANGGVKITQNSLYPTGRHIDLDFLSNM